MDLNSKRLRNLIIVNLILVSGNLAVQIIVFVGAR
jgi:hypothetical protein